MFHFSKNSWGQWGHFVCSCSSEDNCGESNCQLGVFSEKKHKIRDSFEKKWCYYGLKKRDVNDF